MNHADDATPTCTQRAYLYLERKTSASGPPYSEDELELMAFDPGEVTRLVGLHPTATRRRGDPHTHHPTPHRFSSWRYETSPVHTFFTETVVTGLLNTIEPYTAGIADACRTLGMQAGIMVVIEMGPRRDDDGGATVSTADVSYSAETVRRLSRLGLALHHDQYVLLD
jgi:hypothetical protein